MTPFLADIFIAIEIVEKCMENQEML